MRFYPIADMRNAGCEYLILSSLFFRSSLAGQPPLGRIDSRPPPFTFLKALNPPPTGNFRLVGGRILTSVSERLLALLWFCYGVGW